MKNYTILFLFLTLLLNSCVDIIELDLNSSEPHPVIEAYLDSDNAALVSVTMSAPYNGVIDFSQVDALITLSDELGNSEVLKRNSDTACYSGSEIIGSGGREYFLDVQIDSMHYTSVSRMPTPVRIDSVTIVYNKTLSELMQMSPDRDSDDGSIVYDSAYDIAVHYTDNPDEDNFYLTRLTRNQEMLMGYNLTSDVGSNGEPLRSIFIEGFSMSDTMHVALYSIPKDSYEYYQGLSDLGGSDIPYNPYTNIEGEDVVLGFFSTRCIETTSRLMIDWARFDVYE